MEESQLLNRNTKTSQLHSSKKNEECSLVARFAGIELHGQYVRALGFGIVLVRYLQLELPLMDFQERIIFTLLGSEIRNKNHFSISVDDQTVNRSIPLDQEPPCITAYVPAWERLRIITIALMQVLRKFMIQT